MNTVSPDTTTSDAHSRTHSSVADVSGGDMAASSSEDDEAKRGGGGEEGGGGGGGKEEERSTLTVLTERSETTPTEVRGEGTPAAKQQQDQQLTQRNASASVSSPRSGLRLFLSKEAAKIADSLGRGAQARNIKDACRELQGACTHSAPHPRGGVRGGT